MKKTFVAFLLAILCQQATACDICGGVSHLNPYMFPHLSRSYVSFAYLRNLYSSTEDGTLSNSNNSTLLLSGQYTVNGKLQLLAMVPYHFNQTTVGEASSSTEGLGDVTILANYNLFRVQTAALTHAFSLGAGVKLPTGRNGSNNLIDLTSEALQLGTGSLDYLASAIYRVNTGNFTLSTVGSYKYTTPNNGDYRYGDVLTTGATAVYTINRKDISLNPYLQIMNETHYRDAASHVLQNGSGGSVTYAGAGLDVSTSRLTIGANAQVAARQNLMRGNLTAKPKFSARISVTL